VCIFEFRVALLLTRSTSLLGLAAAWGGLLAFDTLVFVMTVAKAILVGRSGDQTLIKILLRDGKCTFVTF
jgi:hypothetical protein